MQEELERIGQWVEAVNQHIDGEGGDDFLYNPVDFVQFTSAVPTEGDLFCTRLYT